MPQTTNHTILGAVRDLLHDVDPAPFSRAGLDQLHARVERFINDLLLESINVAKRLEDGSVEPKHVNHAADIVFLRRKRKIYSLLGALGGIAVGSALAKAVEMSGKEAWSSQEALTVFVLAIVGSVAMTIQLMRE